MFPTLKGLHIKPPPLSAPHPPRNADSPLEAWRNLKDVPMSFVFYKGDTKRRINVRGRDMFIAIGFELAFGLCHAEMAQARWNWLNTAVAGYPVLDGTAKVKNLSGTIRVRALDPWFTITMNRIKAEGWRPEGDG